MNRILSSNNTHKVLVTPTYVSSPSFELMLGNWTDEKLRGFHVIKFDTLEDAMELAFKYPSIDWNKIVSIHEDAYQMITSVIKKTLKDGEFIAEIDSHLMNPTELKETMFERVEHHGERYKIFYDANDVISINIINPWTTNINEITNLLKTIPELRIKKYHKTQTHICLIGVTDVGTTYEIKLWTTLLSHWARWVFDNSLDKKNNIKILTQLIEKQKLIDDDITIR